MINHIICDIILKMRNRSTAQVILITKVTNK